MNLCSSLEYDKSPTANFSMTYDLKSFQEKSFECTLRSVRPPVKKSRNICPVRLLAEGLGRPKRSKNCFQKSVRTLLEQSTNVISLFQTSMISCIYSNFPFLKYVFLQQVIYRDVSCRYVSCMYFNICYM